MSISPFLVSVTMCVKRTNGGYLRAMFSMGILNILKSVFQGFAICPLFVAFSARFL